MLKIAKTEFYKLKRYSVVWIGVATMLTVVLLTRFMATASDGAVHTLEYFSNSVIWNNFSLIFPATITLIAGYIIERERVDDTLKNILTIPIPFRKLLAGKLIAVGGLAIILAAIEFVFTMIIFFISRFPGFSFAGMILELLIKLRQKGVKVPFLLMSGDDDTRLRNEAQACGAVFCCKTDYDLIARINEMVG